MIDALKNKKIGGAALDVLEDELKFDKNHLMFMALSKYENLIITPHLGGKHMSLLKRLKNLF